MSDWQKTKCAVGTVIWLFWCKPDLHQVQITSCCDLHMLSFFLPVVKPTVHTIQVAVLLLLETNFVSVNLSRTKFYLEAFCEIPLVEFKSWFLLSFLHLHVSFQASLQNTHLLGKHLHAQCSKQGEKIQQMCFFLSWLFSSRSVTRLLASLNNH